MDSLQMMPLHVPGSSVPPEPEVASSSSLSSSVNETAAAPVEVSATMNDVIFGRGSGECQHPGNAKLHALIDSFVPWYEATRSRNEKTHIIETVYSQLSCSGRFLRFDQALGCFFLASKDQAREKIGHAMRYRIQLHKKQKRVRSRKVTMNNPASLLNRRAVERTSSEPSHFTSQPTKRSGYKSLFTEDELDEVLGLPGQLKLPDLSQVVSLEYIDLLQTVPDIYQGPRQPMF